MFLNVRLRTMFLLLLITASASRCVLDYTTCSLSLNGIKYTSNNCTRRPARTSSESETLNDISSWNSTFPNSKGLMANST